jgi:Fe(3+) dicitrate transport protein
MSADLQLLRLTIVGFVALPASPGGASERPPTDKHVTIAAQKKAQISRAAGSVHTLDEKELERFEEDDVHQQLAKVPGVYARDEEGFGLRPNIGLRGASPERSAKITLMEDGVLIAPAPYSAPAAYYFPLTTRMTDIEVYKGPGSIAFGPQTIGGAVNLISRALPKRGRAALIDLAGGTFGHAKGHAAAGWRRGNFAASLEGLHLRADGFKQFSDGTPAGGFDKNEWLLKTEWAQSAKLGVSQSLRLRLGFANERSGSTYLGLQRDDFEASPYRRYDASKKDQMSWDHRSARLTHRVRFSASNRIDTVIYRRQFSRDWVKVAHFRDGPSLRALMEETDTPDAAAYLALLRGETDGSGSAQELLLGSNDRAHLSQGIQSEVHWRWRLREGLRIRLRSGLRAHNDSVDRVKSEQAYQLTSGQLRTLEEGMLAVGSKHLWTRALSAHALTEFAWNKRLWVTPGVRSESIVSSLTNTMTLARDPERTQQVLLPGIGVFWKPGKAPFGLLAGAHRGFSPVAPGQDALVRPEQANNFEAGLRWFHPAHRLELIGFFNDYENLTGRCTQSQGCGEDQINEEFNGGAVAIYGLEALSKNNWALTPATRLDLIANLTLTQSRFESSFDSAYKPFGSVQVGDELPYVPRLQGALSAGVTHRGVALFWQSLGRSDVRDRAGQGAVAAVDRVPGHILHNLSLNASLNKQYKLYLTAFNLTNRTYIASLRPYGPRPGSPRRISAGLKAKF